jgi:hypothetical protein
MRPSRVEAVQAAPIGRGFRETFRQMRNGRFNNLLSRNKFFHETDRSEFGTPMFHADPI